MTAKLNSGNRGNTAGHEWLAGLLLRRDTKLVSRFAFYYRELQRRPRYWRRLLQRKLAVTVTGAALLLALSGGPIGPSVLAEPIDTNATISVVNGEVAINDNGKCSLIEAIINARATRAGQLHDDCAAGNLSGPDTVSLPAKGLFVLTEPHNSQFGPTGLPVITTAVTIEGNGSTIRRAGGFWDQPQFRILAVDESGSLTLRHTKIANGSLAYWDNGEDYYGGGIFSNGTLHIAGCTISGNRVSNDYSAAGGGIYATGPTTIFDSVVSGNGAESDNGSASGGGLFAIDEVTISNSQFIDNGVTSYDSPSGGGITSVGVTVITNSTIHSNFNGGGEGSGSGGGIAVGGQAIISGSTISDNVADSYYEGGSYDLHPGLGGGISNGGQTLIVNSTIAGNQANYGGGISNTLDGILTVVNSTITGNQAIRLEYDYDTAHGFGGGIFSAREYGGDNCASTVLRRVILSGNTAGDKGDQIYFEPNDSGTCAASFVVDAFNIFGQNGVSGLTGLNKGPSDLIPSVALSAILSPLADNGGPTQTHALPPGSPALDLAPSASCLAAPVNGVDQRGEPRNQNGAGGVTANECDAGSFELALPPAFLPFLISPASSGTIGGVAFTPADILKYDPATGWSMYFDGSDVGITKNLAAFEVLNNGRILMSFAANQPTPAGTFAPQDIARFTPSSTGPNTAGSFQWAFDGSASLLTTTGEKIDALGDIGDGRVALSTTGAAAVKLPNGVVLKAQDEDALGLIPATGAWSAYFDGTAIKGLPVEDVNALWVDSTTGDLYVSIIGAFNLGGVRGNGKDIVKLTRTPGAPSGYVPSLWWDGSAEGIPVAIDGLEILP